MKAPLVVALTFLVVDITYLRLSRGTYLSAARTVSGEGFPSGRLGSAAAAYLLLIGGFLALVPGLAEKIGGAAAGFVYGVVVYGVFNATNRVMFEGWSTSVSIRDTAWGAILCAAMGALYLKVRGLVVHNVDNVDNGRRGK